MKRSIVLLCAGVIALSLSMPVLAGSGKMCGRTTEDRVEKTAKDLDLTTDQKEKVTTIFKENEGKMAEMREKCKAACEETDKKMKEVLTPAQYEKLEKNKADRKAKIEKKMGCKMGDGMKGCPMMTSCDEKPSGK